MLTMVKKYRNNNNDKKTVSFCNKETISQLDMT